MYAANGAEPNDDLLARLGKERYERLNAFNSFIQSGSRLAFGADWPTTPLNPFLHIYTAMTRSAPGVDEFLPPKSETITIEEAIKAYTINGAYAVGAESYIGSIEVGKRADLITIDTDIFEATPEQIAGTKVLATMMNGKEVYLSEEVKRLLEDFDEFDEFEFHD